MTVFFFVPSAAVQADITPVQTQLIPLTQTDWATSAPSFQGAGGNPLVFDKFDSSLGTLRSVNLTMSYTVVMSASMTFTTASTIVLTSGYQATAGGALQGTTIDLKLGSDPGAAVLLESQAPVLTYTRTFDPGAGAQTFSTLDPPNSPFHLTPDNFASNTVTGTLSTLLTDAAQVALFNGAGTVELPALAYSGSSFSSDSGNGAGTVLTYAGIRVSLSYNYSPVPVPEPSSVALLALMGLGVGLTRVGRCGRSPATPPKPVA